MPPSIRSALFTILATLGTLAYLIVGVILALLLFGLLNVWLLHIPLSTR
jgi:hypothetical protein